MIALDAALVLIALSIAVSALRIARGPTAADRAVAADVCLYALIAGTALIAVRMDAAALADIVVTGALLGFLATVALAWYVLETRR